MKTVLIAGAVVATVLGGLYIVYRTQQPKDPGQVKQAAPPMPVQPQPANFAQTQLAYAPGASPLLTQAAQGVALAGGAVAVAKALGFFNGDDDEEGA